MTDLSGCFALYVDGRWVGAQQSVFSMFGGDSENDEYLEGWPRAGAMRERGVHARESAQEPPRTTSRLWPTPAASLPNDGEEPAQWLRRFFKNATKTSGATRAGVPLAVAARAPVILKLAKINLATEAMKVLEQHASEPDPELGSTDMLNPRWVENLMGFPEGWTEL